MSNETNLTPSAQEFTIAAEHNLMKSAGLDEQNPDTRSGRETYAKNCAEIWTNFLRGLFGAEILRLQQYLRTVENSPRDEHSEIAARADVFRRAAAAGWGSNEVEAYASVLEPGEVFAQFAWDRCVTSKGRSLDRRELRARVRPATWTNDLSWENQFPKIEKPTEDAR